MRIVDNWCIWHVLVVFSSCLHLERVDAPYCSFIVLNMFGIADSVEFILSEFIMS